MKKIILIGDSIRMGYDKYVKEALKDVAEVYYPSENCRFAQNVLRFAHEWKKKGQWPDDVDLVHWNAGLWDCLELFDDGPLSTIEHYVHTIPRIQRRLRMLFPTAKIVFATSTAVVERLARPTFKRSNAVIARYNEAALKALEGMDVIINDLWSITANCPDEYHSDAVHFRTNAGTELLGGKVISVICRELDIDAAQVDIQNFTPEKYSESNIGY
ncbi:MAG: hypothetical protein IKA82_00645 [Clostridia bacterium]|nr:hypothetical protein [Clostridia bacterium]